MLSEAQGLWDSTRREGAQRKATLRSQLAAIQALRAANGDATLVDVDAGGLDAEAVEIVRLWATDRAAVARRCSVPRLRVRKIRDFLSSSTAGSRSAVARGVLSLLRDIHTEAKDPVSGAVVGWRSSVYGDAYSNGWTSAPTATRCPPDHVVARAAYEGASRLILEAGDPGQLPTGTVLSLLKSNSAKSDAVVGLLSRPAEVAGAARQAIFSPRGVSEAKKGMLARVVVDSVLKTWGVTNKKRNVGVGLYSRNVGIDLYARAWRTGPFRAKALEAPHPFERRFLAVRGNSAVGRVLAADVWRGAVCGNGGAPRRAARGHRRPFRARRRRVAGERRGCAGMR